MRTVIKIGTSSITYENGSLNLRRIDDLARIVSDLNNRGEEVIIVSSGAIGAGIGKLNIEKPTEISKKQAIAAIGQAYLMEMYQKAFGTYNKHVAQLLLTKDVIDNEIKNKNVKKTFEELLDLNVIPIVNENDTVSTEELKGESFSDNDNLSSIVSVLMNVDQLIILSNIDGVYGNGLLISEFASIKDAYQYVESSRSTLGTGGMKSKLEAIEFALHHGIDAYIINSMYPEYLYDIFDGIKRGTYFRGK